MGDDIFKVKSQKSKVKSQKSKVKSQKSKVVRYERHIFICTNHRPPESPRGSCGAKGSEDVRAKFKSGLRARGLGGRIRANASGCLDGCEYGVTAVVYPDGVWYGGITVDDVEEIIESHLVGGVPVARLRIPDPAYTPVELLPPEHLNATPPGDSPPANETSTNQA